MTLPQQCASRACCHLAWVVVAAALMIAGHGPPSRSDLRRLERVPRLHEDELSVDGFLGEHVLRAVPLIIELRDAHSDGMLLAALLNSSRCLDQADLPINPLSVQQYLAPIAAFTHQSEVRLRDVVEQTSSAAWPPRPALSTRLVQGLRRWSHYIDTHRLTGILALLEVSQSPLYLADVPLHATCEAASAVLAPTYSLCALEDNVRSALGDEPHGEDHLPRLFLGSPGAEAYPLHQDSADGDVFFRVYGGMKRVAMFPEAARRSLGPLEFLPHPEAAGRVFAHDAFIALPPDSVSEVGYGPEGAWGWSAVLRPGEVLYMPGRLLHHLKNVGPGPAISVCTRPWKTSLRRRVLLERTRQRKRGDG